MPAADRRQKPNNGWKPNDEPVLKLLASYAYNQRKNLAQQFHVGEGLVGQCAFEKERILLTNVPSDYIEISSGLGAASPLNKPSAWTKRARSSEM